MVSVVLGRYAQINSRCLGRFHVQVAMLKSIPSSEPVARWHVTLTEQVTVQNVMLVGTHGRPIPASELVAEDARIFCHAHLESGRTLR